MCITLSSSDQESVLEFVEHIYEFHGLVCLVLHLLFNSGDLLSYSAETANLVHPLHSISSGP